MVNLAEVSKQSRVVNPNIDKGIGAAVQGNVRGNQDIGYLQNFPYLLKGASLEFPKYEPEIPTYGKRIGQAIINIPSTILDIPLKTAGAVGGGIYDFLSMETPEGRRQQLLKAGQAERGRGFEEAKQTPQAPQTQPPTLQPEDKGFGKSDASKIISSQPTLRPEDRGFGKSDAEQGQQLLENVKTQGIEDFLKMARPGIAPKSKEEYIKEYAELTGLDVSGKADPKDAFAVYGFNLMANQLGRGKRGKFDGQRLGRIVSALGQAGLQAYPEYQKAKQQAQAIRAKAGEYALGKTQEDTQKAQARTSLYVIPKDGKSLADRIGRGQYMRVNSYELNALDTSEDFNKKYEILPDGPGAFKELFKESEDYSDKIVKFSLFDGAPDDFQINTYAPKPGKTDLAQKAISSSEIKRGRSMIQSELANINSLEQKFQGFAKSFSGTTPNTLQQVGSYFKRLSGAFGFRDYGSFPEAAKGEDAPQYQKRFLQYMSAKFAPEILQETGKTISDADRKRVQEIVGRISLLTDPAEVAARVAELYRFIVVAKKRNMESAVVNLNSVSGADQMTYGISQKDKDEYERLKNIYKRREDEKGTKRFDEVGNIVGEKSEAEKEAEG